MILLRADLRQLERASKAVRGGLVVPELLLELAYDRMEKVMRFDAFAARDRVDGVERSLRAVDMRDGNGTVEGDDRRWIAPMQLIVMAQNAFPIGRSGIRRETMAGGNAGLQVVIAHVVTVRGGGEMDETTVDERLVPLRAILVVEPEKVAVFILARRETRAAQKHEGEQSVAARGAPGGMRNEEARQPDRFPA